MQAKKTALPSESFYRGLLWDVYDCSSLMCFYVLQFEEWGRETRVNNTCQINTSLYVCLVCAGPTPHV